MTKGFLIIAQNSSHYYHYAVNLALSLKAPYPASNKTEEKLPTKYPVALLCCGRFMNHIKKAHKELFDHIIIMDEEDNFPFYTKTRLYDYTPFDETLYLDCDSLCLSNPDHLFEMFGGSEFLTIVNDQGDYNNIKNRPDNKRMRFDWIEGAEEIYDYYRVPHDRIFQELNSSAIYFSKCDKAKEIFTLAEHFYAADFYPDFRGLGPEMRTGFYPDELAFETAFLHLGYEVKDQFYPLFMAFTHGRKDYGVITWHKVLELGYSLFTLPGRNGHSHNKLWRAYETMTRNFARAYGLANHGNRSYLNDAYANTGQKSKAANFGLTVRYNGRRERKATKEVETILKRYDTKGTGTKHQGITKAVAAES